MANFLRTSYDSLLAIPEEHRYLAHQMYEDSDLSGAKQAEHLFDLCEMLVPGQIVGILANDSVYPPCSNDGPAHYHCDFYQPDWYTVFVAASIWEQYKDDVLIRDQQWRNAHGCKQASASESEARNG